MSGGAIRRFPRTTQATPEASPKIEREKIRHRRPNDLMFDDEQQPAPARTSPPPTSSHDADDLPYDDDYYQGDQVDWGDQEGGERGAPAWDDEPEDDWVLDRDDGSDFQVPDQQSLYDHGAEESGVVWEDDNLPSDNLVEPPDDIAFGRGDDRGGHPPAPEVELAGRRDVRPKAPRPAPAHRAQAPRRPGRAESQPARRPPQPRQTRSLEPEVRWAPHAEPDAAGPGGGSAAFDARRRPARPLDEPGPSGQPSEGERFARTRATLGASPGVSEETVLQPARRGPTPRRHKTPPSPMPRLDATFAAQTGRRRRNALISAFILISLAAGGWYGHQTIGLDGVRPMIDRLMALVPLPSSSRTAADTSFGSQEGSAPVAAEQALSDLAQRIRQQDGGDAATTQSAPAVDPATVSVDGPPIPAFKPSLGVTRSLSTTPPVAATDDADGGDVGEGDGGALSIFKRLWRYVSSS